MPRSSFVWLLAAVAMAGGCGPAAPQAEPAAAEKPTTGKTDVAAAPVPAAPSVVPRFINVAEQCRLNTVIYCGGVHKDHILESVGSGCAWLDFDADGRLDLFLVNAWSLDETPSQVATKGRSALYRNLGEGKFENVAEKAGVAADDWGCGVCTADYNNDGHLDLFVTNFGPCRLYRNRGDGTFAEVAEMAGVAAPGWNSGAAFFDADGDGWLDLYIARYIDCTMTEVLAAERTNVWRNEAKVMVGPFGMRGGRDIFFRNNGDGTFRDGTQEAGLEDTAESYGLGVLTSDLDHDGDTDVYVANDSNPNFLYRNDGQGKFTEIGGWSGAGVTGDGRAQAGMGVDAADFDGDGLAEIVVTNFAQDYSILYKNDGQLFFSDISAPQKMKEATYAQVSWGCAFFDYDLDGWNDVCIANGHIYPQVDSFPKLQESYKQRPTLMRNEAGQLRDVSREAGPGFQIAESMRGLAVGDYDDDGRLDLLLTAIDAPPLLLQNQTEPRGHWTKLRILNRHGSAAVGAVARLTSAGRMQFREVRSGSSYCSQNATDLHFGLGSGDRIEKLEIRWPGGTTATFSDLPADRTHTLRFPAG